MTGRGGLHRLNSLLGRLGFELRPLTLDFDTRLASPWALARMHQDLAQAASDWLAKQSFFTPTPFDLEGEIATFYADYLRSPFRIAHGGSRFNNLLWLFLIAKAYRPSVIVDSGTHLGGSAWALWRGSPESPIYSFDVTLARLIPGVAPIRYIESDWSGHTFTEDLSEGLCYFDDHVDQARRLIEASRAGFPVAVFDDDLSVTSSPVMAHGGSALPKVEFCLDEGLVNERELTWQVRGKKYRWPIDHDQLRRARSVIQHTERLPDTSAITGICQLPYRVVKLAGPA